METLAKCLQLGRHSGSRGFQQVPRRECQQAAVQVDIGLRLKIDISNIDITYTIIHYHDIIIISIDLTTEQEWYLCQTQMRWNTAVKV